MNENERQQDQEAEERKQFAAILGIKPNTNKTEEPFASTLKGEKDYE